jgi:hypothetical protein
MAELGAFFGNPNIQRQGARARALASQRDVNTLPDPLTYAVMQGLLGTRPDEMGFSVLNPDYEKIKKVAEPAFALGLLGQAAPALAPLTKGLPVGASVKNVGKDLSAIQIGDRTIPVTINRIDKKSGGELVNVNPTAFDEAFSKTSWQYVGEKGKEGISGRYEKFENFLKDAKSIEASNVSVNKDGGIVFGDGRHRYAVLRDMGLDELPIVMDKESIKNAKKFGYLSDAPKKPSYPQQEALDTAQRNAALPIEKGGLGLPKDNTAMDRAKAMGFDIDTLHGSPNPYIEAFDPMLAGGNTGNAFDNNIFATSSPESATGYALNWKHYRNTVKTSPEFKAITREENSLLRDIGNLREAGDVEGVANVRARLEELTQQKTNIYNDFMAGKLGSEGSSIYPLMARSEDFLPYEAEGANWMKANRPAIDAAEQAGYSGALIRNVKDNAGANLGTIADVLATSDPSRFRSRFASFDPMRRNETDILAGLLPLGLIDEEKRKEIQSLLE